MHDNTQAEYRQEDILNDRDAKGRKRPWQLHKTQAQLLATAYDIMGHAGKAKRLRMCADNLWYTQDTSGKLTLTHANFCRQRLCPICQWRRSLKLYSQTRQIVDYLAAQAVQRKHLPPAYIMLTVTVPNVDGLDLRHEITMLHQAWQRIMQRAAVRTIARGWQRGTEITYNRSNDTWHPHIHAIIQVNASYFNCHDYISRDRWLQMWRDATRNPHITQVDVRRVYGDIHHAAAEISKYSAKPEDYLDASDVDHMSYILATLDGALANRRFVAWGGEMARAHAALELDNAEDGDLLHISDELDALAASGQLITYAWLPGPRIYLRARKLVNPAPVWAYWAHHYTITRGPSRHAIQRLAASGTTLCIRHPTPRRYRPGCRWYTGPLRRMPRTPG